MQQTKKATYILFSDITEETSPIKDGYFVKLMKDADLCAGMFNCLEVPCPVRHRCEDLLDKIATAATGRETDKTIHLLSYRQFLDFSKKFSKLRIES